MPSILNQIDNRRQTIQSRIDANTSMSHRVTGDIGEILAENDRLERHLTNLRIIEEVERKRSEPGAALWQNRPHQTIRH